MWTLIYNPPPSLRPSPCKPPPASISTVALRRQYDSVAMATMATAEADVSSNRSFRGAASCTCISLLSCEKPFR